MVSCAHGRKTCESHDNPSAHLRRGRKHSCRTRNSLPWWPPQNLRPHSGLWDPRGRRKGPVGFQFIYIAIWRDAELVGKVDPEEKFLRSASKPGSDVITRDLVFKRSPDFIRFYPSPPTTTTHERREFATIAVLDWLLRVFSRGSRMGTGTLKWRRSLGTLVTGGKSMLTRKRSTVSNFLCFLQEAHDFMHH